MIREIISEFKEFAIKGNVIDMAVGIIIGSSFSPIVNSLVNDIIMPPIGLILGNVDFSNLYIPLNNLDKNFDTLEQAQAAGTVTVNYGVFINTLISFLIVSFAVFILVKCINRLRSEQKKENLSQATTKECIYCCSEINIKAKKCPFCGSNL